MFKIRFKVPIRELSSVADTIVIDGNNKYSVHIYGVRMYTGNNPFKFAFWKWFAKYTGNYTIWVNKSSLKK